MFSLGATTLCVARTAGKKAINEYTKHRLAEWRASGRKWIELVEQSKGGLAKSAPSQVSTGKLGVGPVLLDGFATAFGMKPSEYMSAAEEWWETRGKAISDLVDAPPEKQPANVREGLDLLRFMQHPTEDEIKALLSVKPELLEKLTGAEMASVFGILLQGHRRQSDLDEAADEAANALVRIDESKARGAWQQKKVDAAKARAEREQAEATERERVAEEERKKAETGASRTTDSASLHHPKKRRRRKAG